MYCYLGMEDGASSELVWLSLALEIEKYNRECSCSDALMLSKTSLFYSRICDMSTPSLSRERERERER